MLVLAWVVLGACAKSEGIKSDPPPTKKSEPSKQDTAQDKAPSEGNSPAPKKESKKVGTVSTARVGQTAPGFALTSYTGEKVSLADYAGKVVVLEWYNPECPFVKYAYNEGPLKKLIAESRAKGVVWLGINSGAPGNQGHGADTNLSSKKKWVLTKI